MFNTSICSVWVRAIIAWVLIVTITGQLCLLPNLSQYINSDDQTIEQLNKSDPLIDDQLDLTDFIPSEVVVPSAANQTLQAEQHEFRSFHTSTLLQSIRSPPLFS